MTRINYNNGFLYCSLTDNPADYSIIDSDELYDVYKDDIYAECQERGYNEYETAAVMSHYEIRFKNY